MTPSDTLPGRIADALLADPDVFGTGTFHLELSQHAFTLPDGTGWVDANFTGYGSIGATDWIDGLDPNVGDRRFSLLPPAGGFKWTTGDLVNLPQTIYGMRIINDGSNETVGFQIFNPPIPLNRADQTFFAPNPQFRLSPAALS